MLWIVVLVWLAMMIALVAINTTVTVSDRRPDEPRFSVTIVMPDGSERKWPR